MALCFFTSDLHGRPARYETLLARIAEERPRAVFLGGDLLPMPFSAHGRPGAAGLDFLGEELGPRLRRLAETLGDAYPRIFAILGNDDPRREEPAAEALAAEGLWTYLHGRRDALDGFPVYGYACVPPTPFQLKDWERYDVSRFVDPGAVSPEEGRRTVPVPTREIRHGTIHEDLARLVGDDPLERAIFLFHSPPYGGPLDRAALDGRFVDHVPLDVHVGSIAIQRFITRHQPWITLHGHVHEAPRLTGVWRQQLGRTHAFQGAHDGPELALVRFDPTDPGAATRELL